MASVELGVDDIVNVGGVEEGEARAFVWKLRQLLLLSGVQSRPETWKLLSKNLLNSSHPFAVHRLLYHAVYNEWDIASFGPPPVWIPSLALAKSSNLGRLLENYGREFFGNNYVDPITNFRDLHQYSLEHPEVYWKLVLDELNIPFMKRPSCILDVSKTEFNGEPTPGGQWLSGAVVNAAEFCLHSGKRRKEFNTAIIWRNEGEDDHVPESMALKEFRERVCKVAHAVEGCGFLKGDAIAIAMPMTPLSVIIYLGIILSGCVVVSVADSFAASEIESRLRISKAKGIFTQDIILRGGKELPLYTRIIDAKAPLAIVVPGKSTTLSVRLRELDLSWESFMGLTEHLVSPESYKAVPQDIEAFSNILFSSGTTGEPKAIPWTHSTPIKTAADAWAHHDIRSGDVIAWPTNLGWMMGPWLVYAALVNGAAVALYNGSPLGQGFLKFVQDAKVTMLGFVPSIVRHWRKSHSLERFDWSHVRCFSSTGEASSAEEYLWLMSRVGYKPIIEYCGGTEIGGAFVTGSLLQSQALAAFSTPAMGCKLFVLDETRHLPLLPNNGTGIGECCLDPSILGASRVLLNASHFDIYYKGMPQLNGKILRRHGDEIEMMKGGYYKAHGRVDDTMNLGGIKVSSVEIERVCNTSDERVLETAAIGVSPMHGGPEKLIVFAVLKSKDDHHISVHQLLTAFNSAIQHRLNPLFKVDLVIVSSSLPRNASNKVMRRFLRNNFQSNIIKSLL